MTSYPHPYFTPYASSSPTSDFAFLQHPSSPSESSQYGGSDSSLSSNTHVSHSRISAAIPPSNQPSSAYSREPPASLRPASSRPQKSTSKTDIAHPYARLFAKKDEVKRRKIWNHALEKSLFTPYELSTVGAPHRRTIYIASLEAHIDRLHIQLLDLGYYPVPFSDLDPFKGLNSKTAKSMVAGLQHDASIAKLKLLELERANSDLEKILHEAAQEEKDTASLLIRQ